jgi:hypothetical protein
VEGVVPGIAAVAFNGSLEDLDLGGAVVTIEDTRKAIWEAAEGKCGHCGEDVHEGSH